MGLVEFFGECQECKAQWLGCCHKSHAYEFAKELMEATSTAAKVAPTSGDDFFKGVKS
jgi:predicted ATP-dependent serine protease